MIGKWTVEPGMGCAAGLDRRGIRGTAAVPWSRLLLHATMLAMVVSTTVVTLVFTGWFTTAFLADLQDLLARFEWARLQELLADLLEDFLLYLIRQFTDVQGAPVL